MCVFLPARNEHLTAEELAAYLDGALRREERIEVETHLSVCRQCLDELVALSRILEPDGGGSGAEPI